MEMNQNDRELDDGLISSGVAMELLSGTASAS
jgi:hypothetical protein